MRRAMPLRCPRRPIARSARHETDENPRPIPLTAPLADAHENKIDALKCLEKRSSKLCFRCLRSCRKDSMRTATPRPKTRSNTIIYPPVRRYAPSFLRKFRQSPPSAAAVLRFVSQKTQKPYLKAVKRGQNSGKTLAYRAANHQISASITAARRAKRALKSQKRRADNKSRDI